MEAFLSLLQHAHANIDRIRAELNGDRFVIVNKKERHIKASKVPPIRYSKLLDEIIDSFYPLAVKTRGNANTLFRIWEDVIANSSTSKSKTYEKIFSLIQPFLKLFYRTNASLSTRASIWRRPLLDKFGEDSDIYRKSIHMLGVSQEESIRLKEDYRERVKKRAEERPLEYNPEEVIGIARDAAKSANVLNNIVAVLIATGSRLIECVKISKYEAVAGSPETIRIRGFAKSIIKGYIDRPLVALDASTVIALVAHIRESTPFENLENAIISSRIDGPINKVCMDYFGSDFTAHKLRYVWANMAYNMYVEEGGKMPEQEWIREKLGHKSSDTALTYVAVKPRQIRLRNTPEEPADELVFPEFQNPRHRRIPEHEKMELLRSLNQAYRDAGWQLTQRVAKKYRFGSKIITDFNKQKKEDD